MTVDEKGDVMQLISSLSRGFFRLLVEAALVLLADAMMDKVNVVCILLLQLIFLVFVRGEEGREKRVTVSFPEIVEAPPNCVDLK